MNRDCCFVKIFVHVGRAFLLELSIMNKLLLDVQKSDSYIRTKQCTVHFILRCNTYKKVNNSEQKVTLGTNGKDLF